MKEDLEMSEKKEGKRQIYKIFEYLFGGIGIVCLLFWLLVYAGPVISFYNEYDTYPPGWEEIWTEPLFVIGIITLVVALIFDHLAGESEEEKRKKEQELKVKELKLQKKLIAKGLIPEPPEQQQAITPETPQKQFCSSCGKEIDADTTFCKYCGKQQK
jgi:hypothetical protein